MMNTAIMIIWFGVGQYAHFDVERFNTLAECEAAKVVLVEYADESWSRGSLDADRIECREVSAK
jgi:hypothetical protein